MGRPEDYEVLVQGALFGVGLPGRGDASHPGKRARGRQNCRPSRRCQRGRGVEFGAKEEKARKLRFQIVRKKAKG